MNRLFLSITVTVCLTAVFNLRAELVLHWPFEEGSGTTTVDVSGNGHNGSFINLDGITGWTLTLQRTYCAGSSLPCCSECGSGSGQLSGAHSARF